MRQLAFALGLLLSAWGGAALADPCTANESGGVSLPYGASFHGRIDYVIDGDSMCVAVGEGHDQWVEVRLADFNAPEFTSRTGPQAKAALERIALGREARCKAGLRTYDRVAATCQIDGRPVGELLRAAGVREVGNGMGSGMPVQVSGPAPAQRDVYYRYCSDVRAAGVAPIRRGDPGYGAHLDRDGDGIACEPHQQR